MTHWDSKIFEADHDTNFDEVLEAKFGGFYYCTYASDVEQFKEFCCRVCQFSQMQANSKCKLSNPIPCTAQHAGTSCAQWRAWSVRWENGWRECLGYNLRTYSVAESISRDRGGCVHPMLKTSENTNITDESLHFATCTGGGLISSHFFRNSFYTLPKGGFLTKVANS